MSIKSVERFREFTHDPSDPSLVASRGMLPEEIRQKASDYLRHGTSIAVSTAATNLFEPDSPRIPLRALTDGVWGWQSDLVVYVEKYSVALPEEFIEHMRSRGWRCQPLSPDEVEGVWKVLAQQRELLRGE